MRRIKPAKFSVLAFIAIVASSCGGPLQYNKRGDIFYSQGKYALAAGEYRKNKRYYESVNYPIYILNLAVADYRSGSLDEAERAFLAALKLSHGENLTTAEKNFGFLAPKSERTYKLRPFEEVIARFYLAMIYIRKGLLDDAIVEFKKINLLDSGYPLIHYVMGKNYQMKGNMDDAEIEYRKVIELRKDFPYSYFDISRIYEQRGLKEEVEKAVARFKTLLGAAPTNFFADNEKNYQETILIFDLRKFFPPCEKSDKEFFSFKIYVDGKFRGRAWLIEDMNFQKMKNRFRKMIKQRLKNAVRTAIIKKIFGEESSDNTEYRKWDKIPGAIYIFRTYLENGRHKIRAVLFSKDIEVSEDEKNVDASAGAPVKFVFF